MSNEMPSCLQDNIDRYDVLEIVKSKPAICRRCAIHLVQHQIVYTQVRHDSVRASVSCMKRVNFPRMYPTLMVLPNGSEIMVRYKEPRRIITLPLDLSTLTEEEKLKRIAGRRPRTKIKMDDFIEDSFDGSKYMNIMKKSGS